MTFDTPSTTTPSSLSKLALDLQKKVLKEIWYGVLPTGILDSTNTHIWCRRSVAAKLQVATTALTETQDFRAQYDIHVETHCAKLAAVTHRLLPHPNPMNECMHPVGQTAFETTDKSESGALQTFDLSILYLIYKFTVGRLVSSIYT